MDLGITCSVVLYCKKILIGVGQAKPFCDFCLTWMGQRSNGQIIDMCMNQCTNKYRSAWNVRSVQIVSWEILWMLKQNSTTWVDSHKNQSETLSTSSTPHNVLVNVGQNAAAKTHNCFTNAQTSSLNGYKRHTVTVDLTTIESAQHTRMKSFSESDFSLSLIACMDALSCPLL